MGLRLRHAGLTPSKHCITVVIKFYCVEAGFWTDGPANVLSLSQEPNYPFACGQKGCKHA